MPGGMTISSSFHSENPSQLDFETLKLIINVILY